MDSGSDSSPHTHCSHAAPFRPSSRVGSIIMRLPRISHIESPSLAHSPLSAANKKTNFSQYRPCSHADAGSMPLPELASSSLAHNQPTDDRALIDLVDREFHQSKVVLNKTRKKKLPELVSSSLAQKKPTGDRALIDLVDRAFRRSKIVLHKMTTMVIKPGVILQRQKMSFLISLRDNALEATVFQELEPLDIVYMADGEYDRSIWDAIFGTWGDNSNYMRRILWRILGNIDQNKLRLQGADASLIFLEF